MILGLGVPELVIILLVVLVIFGPKNLPKIGSALGKTVRNVREGMEEGKDDDESESPVKSHDHDDAVEVVEDDDDADLPDGATQGGDHVFCSKCGAENAADAAFCSKCGAKLN